MSHRSSPRRMLDGFSSLVSLRFSCHSQLRYVVSFAALACAALIGSAHAQQTAKPLGTTAAPYGYYEYLPFGYAAGVVTQRWPVVIFLHGLDESGNGGTQLSKVLSQGVPQKINAGMNYPFIAISPQTSSGWASGTVDGLVEYVKTAYNIDENRIYVTGLSMGGGGTWRYAEAHPEKLAAVIPICGADSSTNGVKLKNVPTWIFHSYGDDRVTSQWSINWANDIAGDLNGDPPTNMMANYPGIVTGPPGPDNTADKTYTASFDAATKAWTWKLNVVQVAGSHPTLTLYPDASHNSWSRTYNNQNIWKWLLAQTRYSATTPHNKAAAVTITTPGNNAEFDAGINLAIRANVTDSDGTVAKVEFYAGPTKLGEDNTAPYELTWNTIPVGTHWITVKATDNAGSTNASLVKITATPATGDPEVGLIGVTAGVATGSAFFPLERAFDAQPSVSATTGEPSGGTGGQDAPLYSNRHGYIDFGAEWYKVRITATWTRYRASSVGNQSPYADLWWDDDTNTVNDGGFVETRFNFNSATGLSTGSSEPWIRDSDLGAAPVAPKARYLILHSPAAMTNRAKEYAIVGFIEPGATP
jgi:dienelactone hydrolase